MKFFRFALTLIAATSIAAGTASAGSIATPTGLNPGDQFRIVFVTDGTTQATDTTFSTYDNLVQSEASGTTYNGNSITWQAIVSTTTVNAIDHIGYSNTTSIPVYLVDGTKVAGSDNSSGFWSQTVHLHGINEDILGASISGHVWTGTIYTGVSVRGVGTATPSNGNTGATGADWTLDGPNNRAPKTNFYHVYGISEVLTVPQSTASVPEPSTAMLAGLGGLVALAYSFKRKRGGGQSSSPSL